MERPYSKVRKLNVINNLFGILNIIFSISCSILLGIFFSTFIKITWIITLFSIITFFFIFILMLINIGSKLDKRIDDENKKQKSFYALSTGCNSFDDVISKFEKIERLNNDSYLYCFDCASNLNTIVIYRLSDYSKRNIDLQRRYANKFMRLKYPIAKYKNKINGIKYFHDLKIQMYIVNSINEEILEQLKINQFNNGTIGFICCCLNLENGEIIVSSISHGDFNRYDRFISEIINIFNVDYIEERDY